MVGGVISLACSSEDDSPCLKLLTERAGTAATCAEPMDAAVTYGVWVVPDASFVPPECATPWLVLDVRGTLVESASPPPAVAIPGFPGFPKEGGWRMTTRSGADAYVAISVPSESNIVFEPGDEVRVVGSGYWPCEGDGRTSTWNLWHRGQHVLTASDTYLPEGGVLLPTCRTSPEGTCWAGQAELGFDVGGQCQTIAVGQTATINGKLITNHSSEIYQYHPLPPINHEDPNPSQLVCAQSFHVSTITPEKPR
jgi:hypothetical protein